MFTKQGSYFGLVNNGSCSVNDVIVAVFFRIVKHFILKEEITLLIGFDQSLVKHRIHHDSL